MEIPMEYWEEKPEKVKSGEGKQNQIWIFILIRQVKETGRIIFLMKEQLLKSIPLKPTAEEAMAVPCL